MEGSQLYRGAHDAALQANQQSTKYKEDLTTPEKLLQELPLTPSKQSCDETLRPEIVEHVTEEEYDKLQKEHREKEKEGSDDDDDDHDDEEEKGEVDKSEEIRESNSNADTMPLATKTRKRSVVFMDESSESKDDDPPPLRLFFKHSDSPAASAVSTPGSNITSPSEIYSKYLSDRQASSPVSIMKVKENPNDKKQDMAVSAMENSRDEDEPKQPTYVSSGYVIPDVVQSSGDVLPAPSATTTKAFGSMKIGDNTSSVLGKAKSKDIYKLVGMFKAIKLYEQGEEDLQSALIKIGDLAGGPNGIFYNDKHDKDSHYIRNKYGYIQRNHENQINKEGIYFEKLYHLKIMLEDKDFIMKGTDFHTDFSSKEEKLKSDLFNLKQKIRLILKKEKNCIRTYPAIQEIIGTLGSEDVNNPAIQEIIGFSNCHYEKVILKRIKKELGEFGGKKINFSIRDDKYYFARKFTIIGELLHEFTECKIIDKKNQLLQAFKNLDQIRSTLIHCHKNDYLVPDDEKEVINQIINNLNTIIRNINEVNYLQVDYTDEITAKLLKEDSEKLKKILKGTNSLQNQTDIKTEEEKKKEKLHKTIKDLIVEACIAKQTNNLTNEKLGIMDRKYQKTLKRLDNSEKEGYPNNLAEINKDSKLFEEITQKVQQEKKQQEEKCKLEKKQSEENESAAKITKIIAKIDGEMHYLKKVEQQENIGTKKDYIIEHIASIIGQYLKDIEDLDNTKYIPTISSRIINEAIISAKSARNQGLAHNIFSFDSVTFERRVKNDIIPAHEHFQSILNIYEHVRSPIKSVIILHHLGYSFCKLCLYPEAIEYFKQTVELLSVGIAQKHENVKLKDFDQLGIEKYHFIAQKNLANTYLLAGDYNEAYNVLTLITEKIDLSSTAEGLSDDFRESIADILINFASYFISQGNYDVAKKYCEDARIILPSENLKINIYLAGLYRKLREHEKKTEILEYIGTNIVTDNDPIAKCVYLECCADSLVDKLKEDIGKVDEMLALVDEMEKTFINNTRKFKVAYSDQYELIELTPIKLRLHIIYEKSILPTNTQNQLEIQISDLQSQLEKLEEECKKIIKRLNPALKHDEKLTNLYRILTCCFASMINSNNMNNGLKNLEQAQYYFDEAKKAAHFQELIDSAAEKLAIAYSNYSYYLHINDTETRIDYLEKALKIEEDYRRDESVTLMILGFEYCKLGLRFAQSCKFEDAVSNYKKAISYFERSYPLPEECLEQCNQAVIYYSFIIIINCGRVTLK